MLGSCRQLVAHHQQISSGLEQKCVLQCILFSLRMCCICTRFIWFDGLIVYCCRMFLTVLLIILLKYFLKTYSRISLSIVQMGCARCKFTNNSSEGEVNCNWKKIKVINHRWKIERYIAEGGFDFVCIINDAWNLDERYVAKSEKLKNESDIGRLAHEYHVIQQVRKLDTEHFPVMDRELFPNR